MKKAKKILALVVSALLLMSLTVVGTLAYLTSETEVVKNTFAVGNVSLGDPALKDGLTEALVNEYGQPINNDTEKKVVDLKDAPRVLGNDYKLIPGHEYTKDPTVKVAKNSEKAYIRMIVTITDLADVKAVFGTDAASGYFLPQNFVGGWNGNIWVTTNEVKEENNTATYEFRYYTTVDTLDGNDKNLEPLFTSIIVPGNISNENLAKVSDMEINIIAHAIQADGFADATAAWAAWSN